MGSVFLSFQPTYLERKDEFKQMMLMLVIRIKVYINTQQINFTNTK